LQSRSPGVAALRLSFQRFRGEGATRPLMMQIHPKRDVFLGVIGEYGRRNAIQEV
jgi:hypothetical protein